MSVRSRFSVPPRLRNIAETNRRAICSILVCPWTSMSKDHGPETHPPTVPRNYSELPSCHHIGKRWSKDHGPYALYLQTVDYKAHNVPGRQTTLQVMLLKIQQLFVAIQGVIVPQCYKPLMCDKMYYFFQFLFICI